MDRSRSAVRQQRKIRKHRRMALVTVALYLCVLVGAITVDGTVEAQAQHKALAQQAVEIQAGNTEAFQEALDASLAAVRTQDLLLAASLTAEESSGESEAESTEGSESSESSESSSSSSSQSTTPAAKPIANANGEFQADAYGYTGADKIDYWKSQNSDVIGYLRIPGTNISHPVLRNTSDVNYYTSKGIDKQYSYYGVLWTNPNTVVGNSSEISSNTVIYGHNWTNYSATPRIGNANDIMFAQLTGYHWLNMAKSYPYIYYSTEKEQMTFKIFACFYTEVAFNYNQPEGDMEYIISEARDRSLHDFDVKVDSSDKILTLSTCTRAYGATNNQRFVVMARLLRPGETIEPVTVTANTDFKVPNVWG